MKYQEKLEEISREIGEYPDKDIQETLARNPYIDNTKETAFLWGMEQGVKMALNIAKLFKVNKDLKC